jgi:redox-sensitive bicupin YhaK (pirin superfamily)
MSVTVTIRRADQRFHTQIDWLDSWHSFSFGGHYDPNEVGHGLLLVNNDDRVAPDRGFGTHGHRDMEIVTWVLEGAVEHQDTSGGHGIITAGLAQRMSAGHGVRHSEINPSRDEPVHFVQMWVLPDTAGIEPGYEQADVSGDLGVGALVHVAGGPGAGAAVTIQQARADLYAVRLDAGRGADVPTRAATHVFVPRGAVGVVVDGGEAIALGQGDAVRITGQADLHLDGAGGEILIWTTAPGD